MEKILDAILARPDVNIAVLVLLLVVFGLLWVIRQQAASLASVTAAMNKLTDASVDLRLEIAAWKGRR